MTEIDITKIMEVIESEQVPKTVEFKVTEFESKLPAILSNVEAVKQWAILQTEQDRNLVLETEEDFENGKKRCAEINKQITNIENRRKDVKKAYIAPYEIFEKSIKEVIAVLNEAKTNLWSQVTKAEEKLKAKKELEYKTFFEQQAKSNDISDYCRWATIFDKTWLNKGKSKTVVFDEINAKVKIAVDEINAILSLNSSFEAELLREYSNGASIASILAINKELYEQRERLEQRKAEIAHSKAVGEQNTQVRESERVQQQTPLTSQTTRADENAEYGEVTVDFRVITTPQKLKALGEYMRNNGIKYGKVPE